MLHVIDDWYVDDSNSQYTLMKDMHKLWFDEHTGKMSNEYRPVGHYSSLQEALKALIWIREKQIIMTMGVGGI